MAGNLKNLGLTGVTDGSNFYVRTSLTPKARIRYDLLNGNVAYETGGASNKAFSLPNMTEKQDKSKTLTWYRNNHNQEDTPSMRVPVPQSSIRIQDTQANSTDSVANREDKSMMRDENDAVYLGQREVYYNGMNSSGLNQGTWNGNNYRGQNGGDHDYSLMSLQTAIRGASIKMKGDTHNSREDHHGQGFSQFGSGQTFGLGALQGRTDSGTKSDGQESENWMGRTSLTDGLLFSEDNLDGLQAGYSVIYDAVQEYGDWDAARNALPDDVKSAFSGIGIFLYDWGEEMAEFLLTKAPFPPYVKAAIAVGFFMKAVYDIVEEVRKKREHRINEIKAQNPNWEQWEPWKLEEKANESLDAWVIQAIGEKAIGAMLGETTEKFKLNDVAQAALSAAWNRFVAEAKAGRWERRTR